MDPSIYEMHDRQESAHWWFVGRRRIVLDLLRRHLKVQRPRILDLGCGTGGTLPALAALGTVSGVEPSPEAAALARAKSGADVRVGSLPDDIPFEADTFDVVTMLDVLEHVEQDEDALGRVHALLRQDGLLVCTVPALAALWSSHDVLNHHYRRYSRRMLQERLEGAEFRVEKISYFNTILFAPIAVVRWLDRLRPQPSAPTVGVLPAPLNAMLAALFGAERLVLRNASFPIGVSLIAIARKRANGQ